jgi:hypothetical protein
MTRTVILVTALAFTALLGGLTVYVLARTGPDPLSVLSLLILALFAFGIVGALREAPPE